MDSQELDYRALETQQTGAQISTGSRIVECAFDRYLVRVEIGPGNEFLGIVEVAVNKDFLSSAQRIALMKGLGYHDVSEFYRQLEED